MKVVYSPLHLLHRTEYEFLHGKKVPHFEIKERIESIKKKLEKFQEFEFVPVSNGVSNLASNVVSNSASNVVLNPSLNQISTDDCIAKVHDAAYLQFLKQNKTKGIIYNDFCHDTYTFFHEDIYRVSKDAVDVALTGAKLILSGEKIVYCLTRPPGHHARESVAGGYCYLNNGVIAAKYLLENISPNNTSLGNISSHNNSSGNPRIAILDLDVHHGNGTEELIKNSLHFFSISLHLSTQYAYPYYGGEHSQPNQINIFLEKDATEAEYIARVEDAVERVIQFNPKYVLVLFGYDTFKDDPLGGFPLDIHSYSFIGKIVSKIKVPMLILQEGGYSIEPAGEIVYTFLKGVENNG